MTECDRARRRVSRPVLLLSAVTWLMLGVNPGGIVSAAHCPAIICGASPPSFRLLLAITPLSAWAAGWALMLAAMMSPTLIAPVQHVVERNLRRRRFQAVGLFVAGYAVIWMAAGGGLLAASLVLGMLVRDSYLPAAAVGLIAFVWQCSPVKQRCLNRGHNHSALAAFGLAADRDALGFGLTHGVWCVGSCWALMLFPMLLPQGHIAAMAAVTIQMISERLDQPGPLVWRLRGPGKLLRMVVAQTRIRLRAWPSVSASSTSVA